MSEYTVTVAVTYDIVIEASSEAEAEKKALQLDVRVPGYVLETVDFDIVQVEEVEA